MGFQEVRIRLIAMMGHCATTLYERWREFSLFPTPTTLWGLEQTLRARLETRCLVILPLRYLGI